MTKLPLSSLKYTILCTSLFLNLLPLLVISQPPASEQQILLNLKKFWANQPPTQSWGSSTTTNTTASPCGWPGIQCSSGGDTVTGVLLGGQNIQGNVPPFICDLKNLTTLDLSDNFIGGDFPTFLYNCSNLQTLNLSQNLFVGQLPNDINKLSPQLQILDLSGNNFTGDIPSSIGELKELTTLNLVSNLFNGTFPSELGNLVKLENLFLAYNPFSPMELPSEFGMLKSLKFLWMSQCNLIGKIPQSFGNLSSLEHLDLVGNALVGDIPSGLFLLKNLTFLYLYHNKLTGELPTSIEALSLKELDLSNNNLTGTIPEGIGKLPRLEMLILFSNNFYGVLPTNIGLIPTLKVLRLWRNRFTGPLPPELGLHSKLEALEVPENGFTGSLPEHLCAGKTLFGLVAFNNKFNGSIPSSLGQCHSLLTLQVYSNNLSGEIPQGIWTLRNISTFTLSNNQFSGQLPENLAWNMTRVEMNNNRFTGEIPPSVGTWKSLVVFEASNNMLSGTIPLEITSLSRLNTLLLNGNQLSGELPSHINSWKSLNNLNLAGNELSGSIPPVLGSLPVLNYLDLSNNKLTGKIPPELSHLKVTSLNLSSNKLTGSIPYEFDNDAYGDSFLNTNLCSDGGVSNLPKCLIYRQNSKSLSSKYLALILVLAIVAFIATMYFTWFMVKEFRQRKHSHDLTTWKLTSFHKVDFTEEKILVNLNENHMIGSGGSGKVYCIPTNRSGDVVAVKRIWNNKKMNNTLEKEFLAEVQILGTIRHLNIVKLLCCISSEDSKLLVYEYMENQSLDKWIHSGKKRTVSSSMNGSVLDWPARLRIAIGAAQGLSYMHHDCSPPIIHRDVKSSNILLDSEFNAKIADFGLAKILAKPGGQPHTVSAVAGSFGYMAPEYCYTTKVNEKIDIYSFGVVLLELVTGKEPQTGDEYRNLAEWAWRHYSEGHPIADILDEEVNEPCYLDEMINVFKIGLMCTNTVASSRPSMKEVLQVLRQCNVLESSARRKLTKDQDVAPLLGGGSYLSSCKNSRKAVEEDVYSMV